MPGRSASALLIACCVSLAACAAAPPPQSTPAAPSRSASGSAPETIRHLAPPDNSTGAAPARFEWTAVAGADRYAISVFNEVDVPVWQQDDMREPKVDWPTELRVESGTYFWVVAALSNDRPIAQSGRAAFVVLR